MDFLKTLLLFVLTTAICIVAMELVIRWWVPVRNVGPSFSRYDAVYGKLLRANFEATRYSIEFEMSFTTNSLGFRGPEPLLGLLKTPSPADLT